MKRLFLRLRTVRVNNRLSAVLVTAALCLILASCSPGPIDRFDDLMLDLNPDLADLLDSGTDEELATYTFEAGITTIYKFRGGIRGYMAGLSPEDFDDVRARYNQVTMRLARVQTSVFNLDREVENVTLISNLSSTDQHGFHKIQLELAKTADNNEFSTEEKISIYLAYERRLEELGLHYYALYCRMKIIHWNIELENGKYGYNDLKSAVRDLEESGYYRIACQVLGDIGGHYSSLGEYDSMTIYFEKSRRLADRSRFPGQAARVREFYGNSFRKRGRLAMANDQYREGMEICREYRGGMSEIRPIVTAMDFYSNIECWNMTENLVRRVHVLERLHDNANSVDSVFVLKARLHEARMYMVRGDVDSAERILNRHAGLFDDLPYEDYPLNLRLYWALGLMLNGLYDRAIPLLEEGIILARNFNQPRFEADLTFSLAEALYETGRMGDARRSLAAFDSIAADYETRLQKQWINRDVLLARMHLSEGDTFQAVEAMETGLLRLKRYASGKDASAHSYLWIDSLDRLRELVHDLSSHDPVLGYGAELCWRDYYMLLGNDSADGIDLDSAVIWKQAGNGPSTGGNGLSSFDCFRARALATAGRIKELGAEHLLYFVGKGAIWRWTATTDGIRMDVLEISPDETQALVSRTWESMSRDPLDPQAPPGQELTTDLRRLAQTLLPKEVLDRQDHDPASLLLISTHGFLGRVPFEAFNIGPIDDYEPLLERFDIAYLRHTDNAGEDMESGPGVIFASELTGAKTEGKILLDLYPLATFLTDENATKENLLHFGSNASFIHIASHTLRDPAIPYLVMIPVECADKCLGIENSFIDIMDIRSTDLMGCRSVILSGCSTGAPSTETKSGGPSLGDAFLDAGAATVTQTFWDIRDDEAVRFVSLFNELWGRSESTHIRTLSEVKRRSSTGPTGALHPFYWASHSIKLGKL